MQKKFCDRRLKRTFLKKIAPKISGLDHPLKQEEGILLWLSGIPIYPCPGSSLGQAHLLSGYGKSPNDNDVLKIRRRTPVHMTQNDCIVVLIAMDHVSLGNRTLVGPVPKVSSTAVPPAFQNLGKGGLRKKNREGCVQMEGRNSYSSPPRTIPYHRKGCMFCGNVYGSAWPGCLCIIQKSKMQCTPLPLMNPPHN